MFTGLVEHLGTVISVHREPPGQRLRIDVGPLADGAIGDSICINGCCLTAVKVDGNVLDFEAGDETLRRTNLGELAGGDRVNLERALAVGDRLGGHYVSGHIDGVGPLIERIEDPPWATLWFSIPDGLGQQMASKGSVAVDGVSLTLVDVLEDRFSVALIPHTLAHTTLGLRKVGDRVNMETDILAKYVQKQLSATQPQTFG